MNTDHYSGNITGIDSLQTKRKLKCLLRNNKRWYQPQPPPPCEDMRSADPPIKNAHDEARKTIKLFMLNAHPLLKSAYILCNIKSG